MKLTKLITDLCKHKNGAKTLHTSLSSFKVLWECLLKKITRSVLNCGG
jgi:hypothetical protein